MADTELGATENPNKLSLKDWIDTTGFDKLWRCIWARLRQVVPGIDDEDRKDLVQKALERLIEIWNRERDPKSSANWWSLLDPRKPRRGAPGIVRSVALDFLRRQSSRIKRESAAARSEEVPAALVSSETDRREFVELLRRKQSEGCPITETEITVLILKYCEEDVTLEQIASAIGLRGPSSAHAKWQKALRRLRPYLNSDV